MLMTLSHMDFLPLFSKPTGYSFTYQKIFEVGILLGDLLGGIPCSGISVTIQNQTQIAFSSIALMTVVCMFLTVHRVKVKVAKPEEILESFSREPKTIKQHWCFKWIIGPYFNIIQFLYYMSTHMWLTFLYTITGAVLCINAMQCTSHCVQWCSVLSSGF